MRQATGSEATTSMTKDEQPETSHNAPTSSNPAANSLSDRVPPPSEERSETLDEQFVHKAVDKAVQDTIRDESYSHEATSEWTNSIVESLVKTLVQVDRDNKYIGSFPE